MIYCTKMLIWSNRIEGKGKLDRQARQDIYDEIEII